MGMEIKQKLALIAIGISLAGCNSNTSFSSKKSEQNTTPSGANLNNDGVAPQPQPNPPEQGGIQVVNHRGCYAASPVPAVYSFNSGYILSNNDNITWVIAPVSRSSGRMLEQALSSPNKVLGTFTKTNFSNGKPRWKDLEREVFSLPVDQTKLQQLQSASESLENGTVMYFAYTRFGVVASSELSPASLNLQTLRALETSAPSYSFQTFTALVAPRDYCMGNSDGDEHEMCDDKCDSNESPLVLDFKGDGVRATSEAKGVRFDLNSDGEAEKTAWLSPLEIKTISSQQKKTMDDVFLARDLNNNGSIESGRELFGQATVLESGSTSINGFIALSDLDTNRDAVFDSNDNEFKNLLLWEDSNHNGKSEKLELKKLSHFVSSISLKFNPTNESDEHGNKIFSKSTFKTKSGDSKPIVDIYFKYEEQK